MYIVIMIQHEFPHLFHHHHQHRCFSLFLLGSEEDAEATEMLIGNSQNLMQSVKETIKAAEVASDKIHQMENTLHLRWIRRLR